MHLVCAITTLLFLAPMHIGATSCPPSGCPTEGENEDELQFVQTRRTMVNDIGKKDESISSVVGEGDQKAGQEAEASDMQDLYEDSQEEMAGEERAYAEMVEEERAYAKMAEEEMAYAEMGEVGMADEEFAETSDVQDGDEEDTIKVDKEEADDAQLVDSLADIGIRQNRSSSKGPWSYENFPKKCHFVCGVMGGGWRVACTRDFCSGCKSCPYKGPKPPPYNYKKDRILSGIYWVNRGKDVCDRTLDVTSPKPSSWPKVKPVAWWAVVKHHTSCDMFNGDEKNCVDAFWNIKPGVKGTCDYGSIYGSTQCKPQFTKKYTCPRPKGWKRDPIPKHKVPPSNVEWGRYFGPKDYIVDFSKGSGACGRTVSLTNRKAALCGWGKDVVNTPEKEYKAWCLKRYIRSTNDPLDKYFEHYSQVPARWPCMYVKGKGKGNLCTPDWKRKTLESSCR